MPAGPAAGEPIDCCAARASIAKTHDDANDGLVVCARVGVWIGAAAVAAAAEAIRD